MPHPIDEAFQKVLQELRNQHTASGYSVFEVGFYRLPDGAFDVRVYEGSPISADTAEKWTKATDVIRIPAPAKR